MADENDGAAATGGFVHLTEAFFLKSEIADGKHFVHEQNLRFEMCSDGKSQPRLHARAVMLQRRIQKFGYIGKRDNFLEFAGDFPAPHAENCAVQKNIFTPGQLGMKSGADFEQTAERTANFGPANRRLCYSGQNFQQSGLAGAVAANHTDDFAGLNLKGDVAQGPNFSLSAQGGRASQKTSGRVHKAAEAIAQGEISPALADAVALSNRFNLDRRLQLSRLQTQRDDRPFLDDIGNGAFHSSEVEKAAQQHDHYSTR